VVVRVAVVAVLMLAATGCTMWKNPPKGWAGATAGEQLERLWWKDMQAKDWKELDKHLASTFTAVTPAGSYSRTEFLEQLKGLELDDYSLGEFNTQLNGRDFVVSYVIHLRGTRAGQPLPSEPLRMMSVWQQVRKGWILIAHAESGVTPP
jgi:hypothetical protein